MDSIGGVFDALSYMMSSKKSGVVFALLGIALLFGSMILVGVLISSNGLSYGKTQSYCERNGMEIQISSDTEGPKNQYLICQGQGEVSDIYFARYEESIAETTDFGALYSSVKDEGTILEENQGCYKLYFDNGEEGVNYRIIENNFYIDLTAANNEVARKALIELGYPDQNWPE